MPAAAAVLGLSLSMLACSPAAPFAESFDSIVLVTIDTLRADHLPFFGYPTDTAPFLTSLAERGADFRTAFSHSATTGPSHASLFTSLYPLQHRVQNNGQVLDDSFVTLAELFAEQGWQTAAFVSGNAHFGESRIAQGFADYDQPPTPSRESGSRRNLYRRADRTTDRVVRWLERDRADGRFLLWVHYYDPHMPLRPPARFVEELRPVSNHERRTYIDHLLHEHHSPRIPAQVVDKIIEYDAEIRFVDEQLERLYAAVEDAVDGDSLWVITSDHGQGLANHGWFGHHRNIYNEQLRVPLVFHSPSGRIPQRVIDNRLVEHVDVAATLADWLGQDFSTQAAPLQGRSLSPLLLQGRDPDPRRLAFAERRRIFTATESPSHEPGERYALQTLDTKYLWFTEGPDELYDLARDPYETRNLIGEEPLSAEAEELREQLREIVAALDSEGDAGIVDEETLERLRALGYLQ